MIDVFLSDYRPSEDEQYMCSRQRHYFKQKLLTWRRELLAKSGLFLETLKEHGYRPTDILDQSAMLTDIFIDFSSRKRLDKMLQEIDLALDRIENGEYGYCEVTGEDIGLKRLEAMPVATRCVEAQERFEQLAGSRLRSIAA